MSSRDWTAPFRVIFSNPYVLLTLTSLFWGGNAIAGRMTVGEISPYVIVFLRWMAVSILLLALYHNQVAASWNLIRPNMLRLAAMGTIGFTCFNGFFYLAANHTTAINLGILQGSVPVIVLIGAFVLFSTKISYLQVLGTAITMAGVAVVATNGDIGILLNFEIAYGDGIMVIACIFYAVYTLTLKNRPPLSSMVLMTVLAVSAWFSSLLFLGYELINGIDLWPKGSIWFVLVYIIFFPSLLAQVFFIRGVEMIGPERAGIFVNLVPVFSSILAVIILGEEFQIYHAISLLMVLGGIFVAERVSIWLKSKSKDSQGINDS